jgi:PBP1b-binding outer membrane lipoprotein LpoB
MEKIKQLLQILLIAIFLSSCSTSMNKENSTINSEEDINKNNISKKKKMEIKFSCGEDGISEYLDDGWTILKEDTQEKICTWKSIAATKDCDIEKDKGCKLTTPDKIGEEKIYLLVK